MRVSIIRSAGYTSKTTSLRLPATMFHSPAGKRY